MVYFKISLLLSLLLVLLHTSNAFNITRLLEQYPSFSTFNSYLNQTNLAGEINGRKTITVLAVENSAMSPLSGKPTNVLKQIMSVHVVLDYYDVAKLQKLSNKTTILTTLFQASGQASGQQGFINVTDLSTGEVVFGPAIRGSTLGSRLVKSVASQPYNISVLQISNAIIPNGIDGSNTNSSSNSTTSPPSKSPAKAPAPSDKSAEAPGPSSDKTTPPSEAPAGAPSNATAPAAADVPGSPPQPADGPAAAADAPAADADNSSSADVALRLGLNVVMTMTLLFWCLVSMI